MKAIEWWVMKVLAERGDVESRELRGDPVIAEWNRKLVSGDLVYIGTDLCEPIEVYDGIDGQEAGLIRCQKEHARTGIAHKLVLNADPDEWKVR